MRLWEISLVLKALYVIKEVIIMKRIVTFYDGSYAIVNEKDDICCIGISLESVLHKYCRKYDCTMQEAVAEISINDEEVIDL